MDIFKSFNNHDFIKLDELDVCADTKVVILFARFMNNAGADWTYDTHSHSFYELHIPLNGSCNLVLQNTTDTTLKFGDYLLIYPNTNHKFKYFSDDYFRLSVSFNILKNNELLSKDDYYVKTDLNKNLTQLVEQMSGEYYSQNLGYENIVKLCIQAVMIELLRANSYLLYGDNNVAKTNINVLDKSFGFILNNVSLNITAEDVAKNVNMSSRQLNRIFNSNINMTIFEFIRNERILRASEYLKKTGLTLHDIALLTGFNDEYMLCKTFKKITGVTPGKYRMKYKNEG